MDTDPAATSSQTTPERLWPIWIFLALAAVAFGVVEVRWPAPGWQVFWFFLFSGIALQALYSDARNTGTRVGALIPVAVILVSPLGWLLYGIRSRGWGFWKVLGCYLLALALFMVLAAIAAELALEESS